MIHTVLTAALFFFGAACAAAFLRQRRKNAELGKLLQQRSAGDFSEARDALAGLYNRSFFYEYCKAEAVRASSCAFNKPPQEENQFFAVAIFRLENYAELQKTCGREASGQLIKAMAESIAGSAFGRDIVCRCNGAEFGLIFTNVARHDAALAKIDELKRQAETLPAYANGAAIPLKVSVGVSFFDADYIMGDDFSMLRTAEKRAADSKASGQAVFK